MLRRLRWLVGVVAVVIAPGVVAAQAWDAPAARALAERGVARRAAARGEATRPPWRAVARGMLFFLTEVGSGVGDLLPGVPQLVTADELEVEVYGFPSGPGKQVIRRWRQGRFLPAGLDYHRDHLGLVLDDFPDRIRIGEGEEVRDVPHPLSDAGLVAYRFALRDSLAVRSPAGDLLVHALDVIPRDRGTPGVVGTLYLTASRADLVRFTFTFTPASYRDPTVEQLTVELEHALAEGERWIPSRQALEIRRRTPLLDMPIATIIRAAWTVEPPEFDVALPAALLAAPPIAGLERAGPDTGWAVPLAARIREVDEGATAADLATARRAAERLAARALDNLQGLRLGARGGSEFFRANRVQGPALGGGVTVRRGAATLRANAGIGLADGRPTGRVAAAIGGGRTRLLVHAGREFRDVADAPVISGALNTLRTLVAGDDAGDWTLLLGAGAALERRLGGRGTLRLGVDVEESRSVGARFTALDGTRRPNPALGAGTYGIGRLALEVVPGAAGGGVQVGGSVGVEGGAGPSEYLRGEVRLGASLPAGPGRLAATVAGGAAGEGLPAYRSFTLGGRGTLVGEPWRAWGGRRAALGQVEWRLPVPVPAVRLGRYLSTGDRLTVAPFLAAGAAGGALAARVPWQPGGGLRPVAGVAVEWFYGLVRLEAGVALRTGRVGVTVDAGRVWWRIL